MIFAALYLAPGNPIAALSGGRTLPPSSIAVLEARYHLNEPFLAQYWYWLKNALHGNLGISITLRENVSTLIASRIWTTAGLVLYAALIIVALGIGLGILSGLRPGAFDTSTLVTTAVSAAIRGTVHNCRPAVGYATMDGDTSGGLSPLAGIDKAWLRHWLRWMEINGPEGFGPIPALAAINSWRSVTSRVLSSTR